MTRARLFARILAVACACVGAAHGESAHGRESRDPVVQVATGRLRGAAEGDLHVFRGVPFAAPPVGARRFRPPEPAEPWEGVRDAREFAPACPQPRSPLVGGAPKQSEDCLYLNVWTRRERDEPAPVMVWIHGGGFTLGSASTSVCSGAALARRGVVVVAIQYRLGPFGFLCHPALSSESEHGVSGNYGLLDQIEALRWVRDNIAAFGGDPDDVTLFGESAGGVSVALLMLSPLARGLFHRAIVQSGAPGSTIERLREGEAGTGAEAAGVEVAARLGLSGEDDVAGALRRVDAEDLLDAARPVVGLFKGESGRGIRFWPVIDGYVLADAPDALLAAGECARVPLLIGTNQDEGTLFSNTLPVRGPLGYRLAVKRLFGDRADRVLEVFPPPKRGEVEGAVARLITVAAFVAPARSFARGVAANRVPVYRYHFVRVAPGLERTGMGATHGAEIPYVFGSVRGATGIVYDPDDRELSGLMMDAWVRFARTGDPNGEGLPEWPRFTTEDEAFMEFDVPPRVKRGLMQRECDAIDGA